MGFMQAPTSGDFNTFIKYDARAGRWFTKHDGSGEQFEVQNMTAIMDIANIRTGWFQFFEGAAPVKVFDPSLTEPAPRPSPEAKKGFEVLMFSDRNIGGLREFSSTAGVVIEAMNSLYDAWAAAPEQAEGKLPVVQCKGTTAVKSAKSTNYAPKLEIVSWVDRPAALPDMKAAAASAPAPAPTPKPAAQHVPPPATAAPQPAMAGGADVEF